MTTLKEKKGHALSLFVASVACYIMGFFFFFPFLVSAALSLDMVNRGYLKQNAARVRLLSILEIIVWILSAFFAYGIFLVTFVGGIILFVLIIVFFLVSGSMRMNAMRIYDDGIEHDLPMTSINPSSGPSMDKKCKTKPSFPHFELIIG